MNVVTIGLILLASGTEIEETRKAGERSPRESDRRDDESRGDEERRFVVEVEFSRVWESSERIRRFVRQGVRTRRSENRGELEELVRRFASSPQANDPLRIVCRIECSSLGPVDWRATLTVGGASYHDPESGRRAGFPPVAPGDRSWRIDAKTPGRTEAAARLIEDLSLAWRFPLTTAEESSSIESQMVALALVLLERRPLKVRFDSLRREVTLPDIDELLRSVLPEAFPLAVLDRVVWFLREALVRGVGPGTRALSPTGAFEFRGVPYTVEKKQKGKDTQRVVVGARLHRPQSGIAVRESALIDAATGHLVEAGGIVVYAPRLGETKRFGATRWRVRRVE